VGLVFTGVDDWMRISGEPVFVVEALELELMIKTFRGKDDRAKAITYVLATCTPLNLFFLIN